MEWDDLRYVLAVHKAGSVAAAARALNVSQVTVFRRIEKIEKGLGVRLFDRRQHGYAATSAALEIVQQAEQMEDQINALERRVWRQDSLVQGTVRITTTDTIADTVLPKIIRKLRDRHPQLRLDIMVSEQVFNITKRDADIAIRHAVSAPEMLIGHRLTPVKYAVYRAKQLMSRGRRGKHELADLPWVAPDESPIEYRFNNWIQDHGHEARVVYRCNSFVGLAAAVKAGVGVGILSCFTAESLGGLVRLTPPIDELEMQYWVLTHPELRAVARIATVYAFLRESFAELRPLFCGTATPARG